MTIYKIKALEFEMYAEIAQLKAVFCNRPGLDAEQKIKDQYKKSLIFV